MVYPGYLSVALYSSNVNEEAGKGKVGEAGHTALDESVAWAVAPCPAPGVPWPPPHSSATSRRWKRPEVAQWHCQDPCWDLQMWRPVPLPCPNASSHATEISVVCAVCFWQLRVTVTHLRIPFPQLYESSKRSDNNLVAVLTALFSSRGQRSSESADFKTKKIYLKRSNLSFCSSSPSCFPFATTKSWWDPRASVQAVWSFRAMSLHL